MSARPLAGFRCLSFSFSGLACSALTVTVTVTVPVADQRVVGWRDAAARARVSSGSRGPNAVGVSDLDAAQTRVLALGATLSEVDYRGWQARARQQTPDDREAEAK